MNFYDKEYFETPEAPTLEGISEVKDLPCLLKYLAPKEGDQILDIGCGVGRLTEAIAKEGAKVTGLDISQYAIEQAKITYKNHKQLEFICKNALEIEYNKYFDKAFCFHNIEHFPIDDARILLRKIYNALKNDGTLVLGLPINDDYLFRRTIHFIAKRRSWKHYGHLTSFSIKGIKNEVEAAGFKITDMYKISFFAVKVSPQMPQLPLLGLPTICINIRAQKI